MTYDFLKLYLVNKAVDSATALKNTILERYLTQDFVKQMWIAKHMKGEYDRYASGSVPLTLNDSVGKDLVSWSIVGNTIQDVTPSPENPIDVLGTGDWDDTEQKYKIPVVSRGKNLVNLSQDYSWYSTYDRVVSHTNEGIETSGASLAIFPIQLKPNTSYVLTVGEEQSGQTIQWRIYYGDSIVPMGISISSLTEVGLTAKQIFKNITFKTGNSKYFYYGYYCGVNFKATHLQIEENSTATPYEPYIEPTTTNIYLNSPLMQGETISSEGEREVEIGNYVITGEEVFKKDQNYATPCDYCYMSPSQAIPSEYINTVFVTHFTEKPSVSQINQTEGYYKAKTVLCFSLLKTLTGITDDDDANTRVFKMQTWFKNQYANGTPVTVYYQLATPTTETFTPPSIPTQSGTTVLDTDCVVAPSSVTAQYKSSKPDNTLTAMLNILSEV